VSTLWTPSGEHEPKNSKNIKEDPIDPSKEEELEAQQRLEDIREQLAQADVRELIANHCYGLFELAAIYLSQSPPKLEEATVAIDALNGVVTALKGRLGPNEHTITEGLHQLRLAFVQVSVLKDRDSEAAGGRSEPSEKDPSS
jgi:hypothetical protein